jgi:hypothetical protein
MSGPVRFGMVRSGKVGSGLARSGKARRGMVGLCMVWQGGAVCGMAW